DNMVYLSKIYTKSGDRGETGLGEGSRVRKDDPRINAIGEVDELNAVLGLIHSYCPDVPDQNLLRRIQNDLFDLGGDLCVPEAEKAPGITASQHEHLEQAIDRITEGLEPLRSFILPGGTPAAAWLHLARTVCRRAERAVVTLMATEKVNEQVLIYLNRLSDYLFVLARVANDGGQGDVLWVPGANRQGGRSKRTIQRLQRGHRLETQNPERLSTAETRLGLGLVICVLCVICGSSSC